MGNTNRKTRYNVPFYALVDVSIEASSPEEALEIADKLKDKEYDSNSAMFYQKTLLYENPGYVYCDGFGLVYAKDN